MIKIDSRLFISSNREITSRSGSSGSSLITAQLADGLRKDTPHNHTPSTALARLMEGVDQVKLLTKQSAAKDALWDITRLIVVYLLPAP